jgi:CheY-like chemotaxis protein
MVDPLVILLAEDDDGHAALFQRNLRRHGVDNPIVRVADGPTALNYVSFEGEFAERPRSGPLLVLLDIGLPGIDGVEVLRRLKREQDQPDVSVVMISATDNPVEIKRCYDLGCGAYIIKPFEYDEFVEILSRLGLYLHLTMFAGPVPAQAMGSAGIIQPCSCH